MVTIDERNESEMSTSFFYRSISILLDGRLKSMHRRKLEKG